VCVSISGAIDMAVLEQMQLRARAVRAWLKGVVFVAVFLVPLVWVVGDDNPFDWTLAWLSAAFGEDADFRHVLAYMICVLVLLVPGGMLIQAVGAWRLRKGSG
jgi:magnesium-transporting ATPase (P-type)